MSKVRKWRITDIGTDLVADNGERTVYINGEHCLACALVSLLIKYGGDVDLRGRSKYGACYGMLAMTVRANREYHGTEGE